MAQAARARGGSWVHRKSVGCTVAELVEARRFDKRSTELTPKSQGAWLTDSFAPYPRIISPWRTDVIRWAIHLLQSSPRGELRL
jgi:hypothetical protein